MLPFALQSGNVDLVRELMRWAEKAGWVWPFRDIFEGLGALEAPMLEMLSGARPAPPVAAAWGGVG